MNDWPRLDAPASLIRLINHITITLPKTQNEKNKNKKICRYYIMIILWKKKRLKLWAWPKVNPCFGRLVRFLLKGFFSLTLLELLDWLNSGAFFSRNFSDWGLWFLNLVSPIARAFLSFSSLALSSFICKKHLIIWRLLAYYNFIITSIAD